jgi:hypothetical protein
MRALAADETAEPQTLMVAVRSVSLWVVMRLSCNSGQSHELLISQGSNYYQKGCPPNIKTGLDTLAVSVVALANLICLISRHPLAIVSPL